MYSPDIYKKLLFHAFTQTPTHQGREILSPELIRVRNTDWPIKVFYALMRLARVHGLTQDILDVGSSSYNTEEHHHILKPLVARLGTQGAELGNAEVYPSSWGTLELRTALSSFIGDRARRRIDPTTEVMVTRGASSAVDAIMQATGRTTILMPEWSPYFVRSFALLRSKEIVEIPMDPDLHRLKINQISENQAKNSILYLSNPIYPTGTLLDDSFMEHELIPWAKRNNIVVVSDTYVLESSFGTKPIRLFLSYQEAMDTGVECITFSKEFGLPGIRVGGIIGNAGIINAVRLQNSAAIEMIPETNQQIAAHALTEINIPLVGQKIKTELYGVVLPGLTRLAWPMEAPPEAGLPVVLHIPPAFAQSDSPDNSLLFSLHLLLRYGVGMVPGSVHHAMRPPIVLLFLKQPHNRLRSAFERLATQGFQWNREQPDPHAVDALKKLISTVDITNL